MAGSIGDMLFNIMGRDDPRTKLLAAASAQPGGGAYAQPASTPAGTTGAPQQPVAQAYQSPPDLVKLYTDVLDRERSNAMIDRGIGLIGSSLAFPENRQSIMSAFGGGGGSGTGGAASMLEQVMNVQKTNQAIQQMAATRAALPSIAQRYGLDMATAQYLLNSGKLDSVIAEAEKPNKQVVSNADGTSSIVDLSTGVIGEAFGPKKQREIEIIKADNGDQFAVYKDTGQRVGAENIVTGEGSTTDIRDLERANRDRASKDLPPLSMEEFKKIGGGSQAGKALDAAGNPLPDLPKDMAWLRNPDGSVKMDNGVPQAAPVGGSPLEAERTAARTKTTNQRASREIQHSIVTDKIDEALKQSENKDGWLPTTGVIGGSGIAQSIYQPSKDLAETLSTIKANLGFDKLQEMRQNSPTGGALGAISDFENRLLQSTLQSVEQSQSGPQLQGNLRRLKSLLDTIINVGIPEPGVAAPALTDRSGQPVQAPADNGGFKIRSVR